MIEPIASSTDEQATSTLQTVRDTLQLNSIPASGDTVTYYIDKYYEKEYNGISRNHYFLGNINLAVESLSGPNAGVYYILSDHLGSSSLTTNTGGNTTERIDYYPYGAISSQSIAVNIGNNYKFTGKEQDTESNLQYFGARYYDNRVGRFNSIDPVNLELTRSDKLQSILLEPQRLHSYSYSLNNPVNKIDRDGRYVETGLDLISLTLSARDFYANPGAGTAIFLGLDALSTVVPIPALVGYVRHGAQATKILKYFGEVAKFADTSIFNIAKTFAQNAAFKQTARQFARGRAGDSLANLVGHFEKHKGLLDVDSLDGYYKAANEFVDAKQYTHVLKEGLDTVYYNAKNNLTAIINKDNEITSFYKITDLDKLNRLPH